MSSSSMLFKEIKEDNENNQVDAVSIEETASRFYNIGIKKLKDGQFPEAADNFKMALIYSPNWGLAELQMARIYAQQTAGMGLAMHFYSLAALHLPFNINNPTDDNVYEAFSFMVKYSSLHDLANLRLAGMFFQKAPINFFVIENWVAYVKAFEEKKAQLSLLPLVPENKENSSVTPTSTITPSLSK